MKELSIEQKAQRYNKALVIAKGLYAKGAPDSLHLERMFPELNESEDEKIRKTISDILLVDSDEIREILDTNDVLMQDIDAWLKKQGESVEINPTEFDTRLQTLIGKFDSLPKEELIGSLSFWLNVVQNNGTYKPAKKQGEQKPVKNIVEAWKDMRLEVYQQASGNRHEPNYSDDTTKMFSLNDIDEIVEKMSKQSPADKVEPKFHKGQWIVWQDKCYKVNYNGCGYELIDQNGLSTSLEYGTIDEDTHLWTIQDAKDGDVLAASDGSIFLFAGVVDCACKHYVALTTDGAIKFNEGLEHYWETSTAVHPATKEQRDTLMKAMADAGYTFDFEKKELKKIEQKSLLSDFFNAEYERGKVDTLQPIEWSKEDKDYYDAIIAKLEVTQDDAGLTDNQMEFLKSLKQRIGG